MNGPLGEAFGLYHDDVMPSFLLKYQIPHPQEAASGSRSDQNSIFPSEMIVYFRPLNLNYSK